MTGVDPGFPFLDTENPADAKFLNGNYRPFPVIPAQAGIHVSEQLLVVNRPTPVVHVAAL